MENFYLPVNNNNGFLRVYIRERVLEKEEREKKKEEEEENGKSGKTLMEEKDFLFFFFFFQCKRKIFLSLRVIVYSLSLFFFLSII